MTFVDRFERLLSWGEPQEVYASRRMYQGAIVLVVVKAAIYACLE